MIGPARPVPSVSDNAVARCLWWQSLSAPRRPTLAGSVDVDVAIVGGGFTGLWTAFHLAAADPALRILVIEAAHVGFGASGRNGGWCSAYFPTSLDRLAALGGGRDAALRMQRALDATVTAVGADLAAAGIDCGWQQGGTISLACNEPQVTRAQQAVADARTWGLGADHLRWLPRAEAREIVDAHGMLGATYGRACAVLNPAQAVLGLAAAVERSGVRIVERTPVTAVTAHLAHTPAGRVRAEVIVDATEAYRSRRAESAREVIPVYSLMIATEPLPPATWERIGLHERTTVGTWGSVILYAQRTADDRIAIGGRGAPYHLNSAISPLFDHHRPTHRGLHRTLADLLPAAGTARVVAEWGGPLGVPRDWCPSVGLDQRTGLAWAGGYVGDGVAASHLAARTLTALIAPRASVDTDLLTLPWVGHRSPRWEPEPWRWLGVNTALQAAQWADRQETRTGRPSALTAVIDRLTG